MKRRGETQTKEITQEGFCLLISPERADINAYTASLVPSLLSFV
jgi:hypothetical protein